MHHGDVELQADEAAQGVYPRQDQDHLRSYWDNLGLYPPPPPLAIRTWVLTRRQELWLVAGAERRIAEVV
jgi:hypothetical protein